MFPSGLYLDLKTSERQIWSPPDSIFYPKGLPKAGGGWDSRMLFLGQELRWDHGKGWRNRSRKESERAISVLLHHKYNLCEGVIFFEKVLEITCLKREHKKRILTQKSLPQASRHENKISLVFLWFKRYQWERARKIRHFSTLNEMVASHNTNSENSHPRIDKTNLGIYVWPVGNCNFQN